MVSCGSQRIVHLRNLIDHPRTGAGERAAAQRMLHRILEKSCAISDSVADVGRIADLVYADIRAARSASARSRDPIADVPPEVRIVVETPVDAGVSISVDNVPPDWGWVYEDGVRAVSPAFRALVDALADIMSTYHHDGVETRFSSHLAGVVT